VVTLVLSVIGIARSGKSTWGRDKPRLLLRGFAGFVALNCFYYSLKNMPLADATVIQYSSPVFTALLAALLLGERIDRRHGILIGASFLGVLLVAQPSFLFKGHASAGPFVLAIALLGAVASAVAYVTIRRLRTTDGPDVILLYFPLVAMPLSVGPVIRDATMPTALEWFLLLALGVMTQIAQTFMTRGLLNEPAGRATAIGYLQVVFAYVWGMLIFGEHPNALSFVGASVVAASTFLLSRAALTPLRTTPEARDLSMGAPARALWRADRVSARRRNAR
jgi:drug/metabolite transporter (DMT)-like permease